MPLKLKIVSEHADLVGDDAVREYHESGGTIGRALQNDWILPDPDRFISSRHATIDFKGGIYYLADTSSNGVYVNNEMEPIGKGNPRRLFDGDRLRLGDFEIAVSVDSGESLVMPMDEKPSVAPDNIEQFVDEDILRTGMKLLDEEELTGDEEFKSALFGSDSDESEPEPEPEPEIED
jgi:type VI secretion system FHA domain protein